MRSIPTHRRYFTLLALIVGALSSLQVIFSNRLIVLDGRLEQTRTAILEIEKNNEELRAQVASASSFLTLTSKANQEGLTITPQLIAFSPYYKVALGHIK